ncbi:hypothetical protein Ndes2437A_g00722 [Nannochloris sp. 'desiccata']|nr:hypothetical protein KSW81_000097 [Chlorella desiccata (nom. nud.)]
MSQVDAQCSASNWRATPLANNPTPNDLFQPVTFTYYANAVLHATWPAFVGLGAFVLLLLAFTLWRLISACARCSHRRKLKQFFPPIAIPSTTSLKTRKQKAQSVKGKTTSALRWILSLFFLGVVAGCIYGMVKINTELVDDGLDTVGEVQGYAQGVLDSLSDIISAGNAIDTALFSTQNIVDVNINVTDVTTQLECLRPWLQFLPDPIPIQSAVESALSMLDTLAPLLETVSQSLSTLASQNPSAPSGEWVGTLPTLLESQLLLEDLLTQINNFSAAANSLDPSTEIPGTMLAARDALDALLNSPSFGSKMGTMSSTVTALEATQEAVINADEAMSDALTLVQDVLDGPAASLYITLDALTETYSQARPCMLALQARTQEINQTVMLLPEWLEDNVAMLQDTQTRLDGILQVESVDQDGSGLTTAQRLDQALTEAEQQVATAQDVATQLSDARQQITGNGDFAVLVSSLEALGTTMAASETPLNDLLNAMTAYLAGSPAPYSFLAGQVITSGTAAGTTATTLQQWLASAEPVFLQAQTMLTQLQTNDFTATIAELSTELEMLPTGQELLVPINEYAAQFASLPQPATSLIDEATSQASAIVGDISAAIVDARSVLGDAIAEAESTSETLSGVAVDDIDQYVAQYEPDARYYDSIRQAALYSFFAVAILLNLILVVGAIMLWPAALKLAVLLSLVLFTVGFSLVVVATAGLKVGTDGCANLEAQVLQRLEDPQAFIIARYYFYNEGSTDPKSILLDVFGLDVDAAVQQVVAAREDLQSSLSTYSLQGALSSAVTTAMDSSYEVVDAISTTLAKLSYENINDVYVGIKQYPCCTGLDFIGGIWTALIISGSFTFTQCIVAMILIGLFDKLQLPRCCMWYSGKAGEAALLKFNGGGGETINSGELEAGRATNTVAAPVPVVMTKAAPPPPKQSRVF